MALTARCHGQGLLSSCCQSCVGQRDGSCGHLVAVILESRACGQVATRQLLAQVPATAEWGKV